MVQKIQSVIRIVQRYRVFIALLFILSIAFALRWQNIADVKNVDELNIIKRAELVADGQWHIKWYNWPAQSLIHIYGVVYWVADLLHGTADLNSNDPINRPGHFIIGRTISLLFGLLSIVCVFWLGRMIHSNKAGLLAAVLLSFSSLHVLHSQFVTPDIPMTAALLINCIIALYLLRQPLKSSALWKLYALAGLIVGFGIATKYTGVVTAFPLVIVHVMRAWQLQSTWSKRLKAAVWNPMILIAVGTTLVSHTIFNPFAIIDYKMVLKNFFFEAKSDRIGFANRPPLENFINHLKVYFGGLQVWNGTLISWVAYVTMFFGFLKIRTKTWQSASVLTITFVMIISGLSWHGLIWSRWAVPFTPFIALLAALGMVAATQWCIKRWQHSLWWYIGLTIITIIMVVPQGILIVVRHHQIANSTTGQAMADFITSHLPPDSAIEADSNFIKLPKSYILRQEQIYIYDKTVAEYQYEGIDYVIVKPSRYAGALAKPDRFPQIIKFFEDLQHSGTLITEIKPTKDDVLNFRKDIEFYKWLLTHDWKELFESRKGGVLQLYEI